MSSEILVNLLILVALVLANGFFVAAEFSLVRVRRTRIQELVTSGNTTAVIVKDAIDNLDDYISATQVGITLASLALGWVGESFLAHTIMEPLFESIFGKSATGIAASSHGISIAIAFFIITYLHVVIGELLPKNLALQFPEKMSLYIARPMRFFKVIFHPLIWLLNGSSNRITRAMGIKPASTHSLALSEEELLMLLSESKKAGVVSEDEQIMLQRVFKFHDKTVREIMIPRPDVVALELRATEQQILEAFKQGYSRMPLYDGTFNNVKGIVYVKDLIYTLQEPKLIKLVDLLRECIFVPESKAVAALLRDFQKARVHMAIVVDEFGDSAGLVTLEDVIEEIVGEIQDEYDYEPAQIERAKDGTVIFDGKTDLERFREIFPGFEMPEGSFETIAGLVFQLAGRVPREADVVKHDGFAFRVVRRDGRRLRKIAVKRDVSADPTSTTNAVTLDQAQASADILAMVPVNESHGEGASTSGRIEGEKRGSSESGRLNPVEPVESPDRPNASARH